MKETRQIKCKKNLKDDKGRLIFKSGETYNYVVDFINIYHIYARKNGFYRFSFNEDGNWIYIHDYFLTNSEMRKLKIKSIL